MNVLSVGWAIFVIVAFAPKQRETQDGPAFVPDIAQSHSFVGGSSPFNPPEPGDSTFVVDEGSGLDTGCTFSGDGPLAFCIEVTRVVGDVSLLRQHGLISETAKIRMPAFDVDFDANVPGFNPERDRVFFNGNVVPGEFLTGANGIWKLNSFNIPIEWVNFPSDPGLGGTPESAFNEILIDIDVANSQEVWCTAIDWAALTIDVARPVVMVHGILSGGGTWSSQWVPALTGLGLPNSNNLSMGNLDSIANNAVKIAQEVSKAKDRWGVKKVNLVCHSKGGLDSRHFVENNSGVEQVIQLGTPNAGSPLADVIQAGLFGLGGPLGGLVNALAGPAGIQLTTGYMAIYNFFHGSNPQVLYTALAGNYDPDCLLCRPVDTLLLAITGPGDTIVPITSVHALSYTENRLFSSSGSDEQAKHTNLTGSAGVYQKVFDLVTAFGASAAEGPPPSAPTLVPTQTIGETIQEGQVNNHELAIDESLPGAFSLFYPSGDLDLALVSPTGEVFDSSTVPGNPGVGFQDGDILGGRAEVYTFAQLQPGVWTIQVSAPSVTDPSGSVAYNVTAWLEDPSLEFSASLAEPHVHAGDALMLLGTLVQSGAPVLDSSVSATIGLPDGSTAAAVLLDDGNPPDDIADDGIYSASFSSTSQPGTYQIALVAEDNGFGANPAFSRSVFVLATVSNSASTLPGTFSDFGQDSNGNGLFDELVIGADVVITEVGAYRLFGVLQDSAGTKIEANSLQTLEAGPTTVFLSFDGRTIFRNRVDGPYTLAMIALAEEEGLSILPVDQMTDAYQTVAYLFGQFEHAPISLTGDGTASGIDTNGNGLFDILHVEVGAEVDNPGFYEWSARLTDVNATEIGFDDGVAFFAPGVNFVAFDFEGMPIGENGVDGPYAVQDLLLLGAGESLVAFEVFETEPFPASQFEGGNDPPDCGPAALAEVVLWPPNHQMIGIDVLAVTGITDPNGDPVEVIVDGVTQDEPVNAPGGGDGNTVPDGAGVGTGIVHVRAERAGPGNGRVYHVSFTASDGQGGTCQGVLVVKVPHDQGGDDAVDDGQQFDSTGP